LPEPVGANLSFLKKFGKEIDLFQLMDLAVEWGLDGLHITGCDLETKDDARLAAVREAAQDHGLYLEYNFSRNEEFDPRLTDTLEKGIDITHKIGADLAKLSLDIRRPRPLYGSCFHPKVMRQLCDVHEEILAVLPVLEKNGIKLAPFAFCNHFCDHKLTRDQFGIRFHGVALGDGDIDCVKTLQIICDQSPTDRITFEIEWDMGEDSLEVAREKEMAACKKSIQYARKILKIGRPV
jgi:hypothetical protein